MGKFVEKADHLRSDPSTVGLGYIIEEEDRKEGEGRMKKGRGFA